MKRRTAAIGTVIAGIGLAPALPADPAAADAYTWTCSGTTRSWWSDWYGSSIGAKYNTSRFQHRDCRVAGTPTNWQFIGSETRASRGCGGTDRWRVRSQHFRSAAFTNDSPVSLWRTNDCNMASAGLVSSIGQVASGQSITMQTKVDQNCIPGSPSNCSSFNAYVSKAIQP